MSANSQNKLIFFSLADPNTAEYYIAQINFHLSMPEPSIEKILQLANDGLAKHPNNISLLVAKSSMFYQLGKFEEEEAVLRKAFELLPKDAPLLYRLGDCLLRQGSINERAEEILWFFEQAVKNDPDNPQYLNGQGTALLSLDRPKEAWHVLQSALERNPPYPAPVRFSCGIARLQAGLNDEITREHLKYAWRNEVQPAGYALAASFKLAGHNLQADEILSFAMQGDQGAFLSVYDGFVAESTRSNENWQPE